MFSLAFEFETEEEMKKAAEQLWTKHSVTGELEMYVTNSGRYRLNIHSEKTIRDSVLEKFSGKRLQAKSSFGSKLPKEVISEDD